MSSEPYPPAVLTVGQEYRWGDSCHEE